MRGKHLGFADYKQRIIDKRTKMEKFLTVKAKDVPCEPLIDLIEPVYPKESSNVGRTPIP